MKSFALGGRARVSRVLVAVFSALMSLGLASAQARQTAGIAVVVADASGAVVPDARIQLKNDRGDLLVKGVTNQVGTAIMTGLPSGSYTMAVDTPGFETHRERVDTEAGKITNIEVTLRVAGTICPVLASTEFDQPEETSIELIAYIQLISLPPDRPNFFRRFFGGLFHKLGF